MCVLMVSTLSGLRKIIFGNPERNQPLISPDGSQIAFLAPLNGVMNVWVGPTADLSAAKAVTQEKLRPIRTFQWANNGTHLLYLQDEGGNENFHLFVVDLAAGTTKDLTPFKSTRAEIMASSYERPDEEVLEMWRIAVEEVRELIDGPWS